MVNTNFTVTSEGNAGSGATSLNGAIASIDVGGANAAINTHYTITFGSTINLTDGDLLAVNLSSGSSLTIQGGNFLLNGGGNQRGFFVYSGAVDIHNLTIENTQAVGGNGGSGGGGGGAGLGGGLFVASAGSVVLDNVSFSGSKAIGGNGGTNFVNPTGNFAEPGGGGGMGGNGGNGTDDGYTNAIGGGGGGGLGLGANGGEGYGGAVGTGIVPGAGAGAGGQNGAAGATWGGGGGGGGHVVMTTVSTPGMPTPGGGTSSGMTFQITYGSAGNGGGGGIGAVTTSRPNGGFGGGGGGAGFHTPGGGGTGGFGGGGGGGIYHGGHGGFGGGGGGFAAGAGGAPANTTAGGQAGFGGGHGGGGVGGSGTEIGGGGGGLGAGGDIFVQSGGSLTIEGGTLSGGVVTAGLGGTASGGVPAGGVGSAYGSGIFIQGNETITFSPTSGQTETVSDVIADMTGSHDASHETGQGNIVVNGGGTVVLDAVNTYTGTTTISQATTLELGNAAGAGTSEIIFQSGSTGTLRIDGTTMPTNTIDGFAAGDIIDLRGVAFTAGATASYSSITDVLTVKSDGVTEYLTLTDATGTGIETASDGAGGTPGTEIGFDLISLKSASASAASSVDFSAAHTVTLTLDTSENMTVASGTTLSLSDGGTATYVSGSGTSTLTFTFSATGAPQALTVTGISAGSIEDSNSNSLPVAGTSVSPYLVAVTDSAANVSANFDSLDSAVSHISSITLTDGVTPDLDLTASQVLNDQTLIGKIVSSYDLVVNDSAANIGSNFDSLNNYAPEISAVTFTGTGTPTLDLTANQVINDQALIGLIASGSAHLVLHDSAGNIGSNLDALAAFQANAATNGQEALSSVQFTDGGTPAIYLAAAQVVSDQALLGLISPGSVDLVLYDSASDIASNLAALNTHASELSWIQFTDSGTPTIDLTAAQVVGDQALLGLIALGSANLVLQDSGANIQANFDALATFQADAEFSGHDALSSVTFTDSGTPNLDLTAAQILGDQALIGELTANSCHLVLEDSAANIAASFASLETYASGISSVVFTDSSTPNLDLTAAEVLGDTTLLGKLTPGSYHLVVSDSAADVSASFDSLNNEVANISSIQFNDSGTPSLDLTATQIVGDQTLIGKITGSYNLVLNDSAAAIQSDFNSLNNNVSEISSIQFTDTGTPTLDLTASQLLNSQTLIGKITGSYDLVLDDKATTIQAAFCSLNNDASEISSVQFVGSGTPTLTLTAYDVSVDQALIGKITVPHNLVVADTAQQIEWRFATLAADASEISSVKVSSGSTIIGVTTAEVLGDQALIGKITGTHYLVAYDSAATIQANFDALENDAASLTDVVFTDTTTPTLTLTATQVANDATLLSEMYDAYDLMVTGVTGQAYGSYESVFGAQDALQQTTDFNTNGSESIYAYVSGLTLTGDAAADTFYLQSAPDVTATGGSGNDVFFFGSGFSSSDQITGGSGTNTLTLDGTYTGLAISTSMMSDIQTLRLSPGHNYNITLDAGVLTTGEALTVSATALTSANSLTFDASAITAGSLTINAGPGVDDLTGSSGTNLFTMGAGLTAADEINGGTGTTTVTLDGDYSAGVTFTSTTMTNVGTLDLTAGYSYDLVLGSDTVASGQAMTIQGNTLVTGNGMTIDASAVTAGSLTINAGAGVDILTGGGGTNDFMMRGFFTAADELNGGSGTTTVDLDGDYSAGVVFNATTMTNVDTLYLTTGYGYKLTLNADTVTSGQSMTIQGGALVAANGMTIDGSAVTAGSLTIVGGAGTNSLIGGAGSDTIRAGSGADIIEGGLGADKLYAGSGADTFAYNTASESASTGYDVISGFNTSLDKIDLLGSLSSVTTINTAVTTGHLATATFDANLATAIGAAQLSAHGAVLFTPSTGGLAGDTFLIIDEHGAAGYLAGQDLVIEITSGVNLSSLGLSNFESGV